MLKQLTLRTKFLAMLLSGGLAVTGATLLVVRRAVESQIRAEIMANLRNSVLTFRAFQAEREATLTRSAELLADLPTVKAVMPTEHEITIQDFTNEIWRISGGDLLVLATPANEVMAIHATTQGITGENVKEAMGRVSSASSNQQWWFLNGHLYEVFLQLIYSGRPGEGAVLGVLAIGYEINHALAADVSKITGSQLTFLYGSSLVATTIDSSKQPDFTRKVTDIAASTERAPEDLQLSNERYLGAWVDLTSGASPGVRLNVLESYDEATARFRGLYRVLGALGIISVSGLSLISFIVFRRYTGPLEQLVAGVRALGKGDFSYPLEVRGNDELAEATASFIRMRDDLQQAQRKLLESERLATIGRMASSISHDLRHQLTSIMANSEFLSEPDLSPEQSQELYQEIRDAIGRMTELIDSLLEFSRGRDALSLSYGSLERTMQRAIRSVQSYPSVQEVDLKLSCVGECEGWFDARRLERAFYNLLLNACQATSPNPGVVDITMQRTEHGVEVSIRDNGPGIPENLHDKIFEPFVSHGKENGFGLGLTIVQKIVEEHGGKIKLANWSPGQTTFQMTLPLGSRPEGEASEETTSFSQDNITSTH